MVSKQRGLGKNHPGGKDRGGKGKGKAKKVVKAVGKGQSGRFRQANNRSWTMDT